MKKYLLIFASLLIVTSANAGLNEILGNDQADKNCYSDYQCNTLCCSSSTGQCAEHDPSKGVFCNKFPAETCVSSIFCQSQIVVTCKNYKTGMKADGTVACAVRCFPIETRGPCVNGLCKSPSSPPMPQGDPNDCTDAIDP